MRCCFLINPEAGGKKGETLYRSLHELNDAGGFDGEILSILDFDIAELIQRALHYPTILVAGGDGTFSMIARHLIDHDVRVGIIPLGTGNDLAKEIGVYPAPSLTQPERLLKTYSALQAKDLTLWQLRWGRKSEEVVIFANYVSFGYDASVVQSFDSWRSRHPWISAHFGIVGNRSLYGFAGMKNLFQPSIVRCEMMSEDHEQGTTYRNLRSIFFSNIKSVMGLGTSCVESNPFDDQIEFLPISGLLDYVKFLLPGWLRGHFRQNWQSEKEWTIRGLVEPLAMQVDGDAMMISDQREYTISRAGTVQLLVAAPANSP